MAPTMFMTPVTVPLNWPPMSIGTAHAGPITHSRKKNDAARQRMEVSGVGGERGGNHKQQPPTEIPGGDHVRRARRAFFVRLKIKSDKCSSDRCRRSCRQTKAPIPRSPARSGTSADARADKWDTT